MTQNSGTPGGGISVSIRGINSLNGNEPLYVIDGVAISGNNTSNSSVLSSINPADIVSMEVLKDASATAIYGSRASNGVVLITTRQGEEGKTKVSYEGYYALQQLPKKLETLTLPEYAVYQNLRAATIGFGAREEFKDPSLLSRGTDWQNEIFRTAPMHNHQINISGGSKSMKYSLSGGYMQQDGIVFGSDFERFSFRVNMDNDINKWLTTGLRASVARTQQTNNVDGSGAIYNALNQLPEVPARNPDGSFGMQTENMYGTYFSNPLSDLIQNENYSRNTQVYVNAFADIKLWKGLVFRTEYAANFNYSNDYKFTPSYDYEHFKQQSSASRGAGNGSNWTLKTYFTYNNTFGKHGLSAMLGHEAQENKYESLSGSRTNFLFNSVHELDAGDATTAKANSSRGSSAIESYFGRLNYSYKGKYMFAASLRHEGSTKFGADHKWGNFPSVSAAWNIKGEQFLEDTDVLSILKLRAGYGVTGTVPSDPYMSLNTLNFGTYVYYNNQWIKTIRPDSNANPELRWEKKKEINIGVDFGFWEDRITGNIDYYNRKTEDLLWDYDVPSPPYLFSRMVANAGSMRNQGIEAGITVIPVQTKDFQWTTSMNYSTNKNELLSLSNDQFVSSGYSDQGSTGEPLQTTTHRIQEGQPIGNFWGYKSIDIDENGHWIIEGADGSPKPISQLQPTDKQIIGNGLPKHYLNWNNTLNWKNFDFNMTMRGAFGFDILNMPRLQYESPVMLSRGNVLNAAFDTKYGKVPLAADQELQYVSYYIEKGNYWKIDNVTLGYTFKFNSWIKRLRIYGTISNLATITGYSGIDPEVSISGLAPGVDNKNRYPSTRTYTLGISVKF